MMQKNWHPSLKFYDSTIIKILGSPSGKGGIYYLPLHIWSGDKYDEAHIRFTIEWGDSHLIISGHLRPIETLGSWRKPLYHYCIYIPKIEFPQVNLFAPQYPEGMGWIFKKIDKLCSNAKASLTIKEGARRSKENGYWDNYNRYVINSKQFSSTIDWYFLDTYDMNCKDWTHYFVEIPGRLQMLAKCGLQSAEFIRNLTQTLSNAPK